MLKKTAFVFDTNFIIQNQQLDEVLDKLKDRYSIYITQVSIDERIAQNCRELRAKFDEAERCQEKFIRFATISFKKTYEEESEYYKKVFRKNMKPILVIILFRLPKMERPSRPF